MRIVDSKSRLAYVLGGFIIFGQTFRYSEKLLYVQYEKRGKRYLNYADPCLCTTESYIVGTAMLNGAKLSVC